MDIEPGETETVQLRIPFNEFAYFDAKGEKHSLNNNVVLRLGEDPSAAAARFTVTFNK